MKAKKQKEYFIKSRLNWLDILEHQKKQKEKEVKKLLEQPAKKRCYLVYNHYNIIINNIYNLLYIINQLYTKNDVILYNNQFYYNNFRKLERYILSFDYLIDFNNYI